MKICLPQVNQVLTEAANRLEQQLTIQLASQLGKLEKDQSDLAQKLAQKESELETARENEKKSLEQVTKTLSDLSEVNLKVFSLEQELVNQGEILRVVMQKLVLTRGFTSLVSSVCQVSASAVRSATLEQIHDALDVPSRWKELGWHPHTSDIAKREYALKVMQSPPQFDLIDYICAQPWALTLEEVRALDVDLDTSLAADAAKVISDVYEDLDQDDPEDVTGEEEDTEAEEDEGEVGNEENKDAEEAKETEDNPSGHTVDPSGSAPAQAITTQPEVHTENT